MKKILLVLSFVFLLFTIVGCVETEDVKIIVDEEITLFIDETYIVEPVLNIDKEEEDFEYISKNETIFMMNKERLVPISAGSADLIIKLEDTDIEVTVKVTVNERPEIKDVLLMFDNMSSNILIGEEVIFDLLADFQKVTENITWSSSDESVASVNSNGLVLGKSSGITYIKANYLNKSVETQINVSSTKEVTGNTITVSGIKFLEVGELTQLKATNVTVSGGTYAYTSSNEDIATITSSGIVRGVNEGVTTITVKIVEMPSVQFSFEMTIINPVIEAKVQNNEMVIGDNENLITIRDSKGSVIGRHLCEFKSLNEDIVTVSSDGVITAVGIGSATIEVKYNNSVTTVDVKVNEAPEINYRNLIIQKALGEDGYVEGYNNDTKYGTWYGMPNQPWCAMFVSWSADQVGIPNTIIPKYAAVASGLAWYQAKGSDYYKSYEETQKGEYVPITGDIVFFKSNGASHTGLVIKVVGDIMYTIEGNTSNRVALRFYYYKNYNKITGYGVPNYQASSTAVKDFDITRATFGGGVSTN